MTIENPLFPARSEAGKKALDIFYRGFNDINFYFEDKDQNNFYLEIIRKIFPKMKITRVFPLTGKSSVLGHAKTTINDESQIYIYIVDKDFDDFLSLKVDGDDARIFYLDKYCIENYLIDEDALVNVVIETHPKLSTPVIRNDLDFHNVKNIFYSDLKKLFRLFYCVQKLQLGMKNCSSVAEQYSFKNKRWLIDSDLVAAYHEEVILTAKEKNITPPIIDPLLDERCTISDNFEPDTYISGKFLLNLMFHYTKSKYKMGSISQDSFMFRLAKNCSFESLIPLSQKIYTHVEQLKLAK
jgi:hypothetical protein